MYIDDCKVPITITSVHYVTEYFNRNRLQCDILMIINMTFIKMELLKVIKCFKDINAV